MNEEQGSSGPNLIFDQSLLNLRLISVQECIKRTRVALLFWLFAASVSLVCLINMEFSIDKISAFSTAFIREDIKTPAHNQGMDSLPVSTDEHQIDRTPRILPNGNAISPDNLEPGANRVDTTSKDDFRASLIQHWMDGLYLSFPLLGVRVSVRDFALYQSAALVFLGLYYLLSIRRENRELGNFLADVRERLYTDVIQYTDNPKYHYLVSETVYRAICAFMIFNVPSHGDRRFKTMDDAADESDETKPHVVGLRSLINTIFLVPSISMASLLAYQFTHLHEVKTIKKPYVIIIFMIVEVFCFLYVTYLSWQIRSFHAATRNLVFVDFRNYVKSLSGCLTLKHLAVPKQNHSFWRRFRW